MSNVTSLIHVKDQRANSARGQLEISKSKGTFNTLSGKMTIPILVLKCRKGQAMISIAPSARQRADIKLL